MDQRQQETGRDNDELTFGEFKDQLRQFRQFVLAAGNYVVRSVRRRYGWFILLLAGLMTLGYYQYRTQQSFTATSAYVYNELTKKTYGEMIDKLQDMIISGSYHQVALALQMPEEQARSLVYISARNLYGSKLSEDITEKEKSFYITAVTTDNKMFDKLQPALEQYLNNNLLAVKMVGQKVEKMKERLAYLQSEASMLDSLKQAYTRSLEKPQSSVSPNANPFNPVELYEQSGKINQEIVDINAMMLDKRAVITADKFMVREHRFEKSLASYLLKYLAIFVAASLLLLFIFSFFRAPAAGQ